MPSRHLILCGPLLLLPSIFPSIRVFPNESVLCMRWPKYWSFSFSISPYNEQSGLIFRMDWLDLLAVQGTLKSLLQHHSSKASILQCSAFFIVQFSYPYMATRKTIPWLDGSDWLVFCDCGFQSGFPLMEKDKRLMEASWWERLTEGETESCSDGHSHAQ